MAKRICLLTRHETNCKDSCSICGCVFEADDTEYKYQFCQREAEEWWECKCPNCGKLTNKSIPTRQKLHFIKKEL